METKNTHKYTRWLGIGLRGYLIYTFLYHGIRALMVEEAWIPMFTAIGLSSDIAMTLMPIIGVVDIAVALLLFRRPSRFVAAWAGLWPIIPSIGAYMTGNSSLSHEVMHVIPPLIAGGVLFFIYTKKSREHNLQNKQV